MRYSKIILIIFLLITTTFVMRSRAQSFKTVGLRTGLTSGLSYKQYLGDDIGFELIASFRDKGCYMTALYEYHVPSSSLFSKQLKFYYGFGLHAGIYSKPGHFRLITFPDGEQAYEAGRVVRPTMGFDGVFGVEYQLASFPLLVGADFKPFISIFGPYKTGLGFFDFGLTAKYIF